jgi:predicted phosphodiesterase
MKRFLQRILAKPVQWLVNRFSSEPNRERVHASLSDLYKEIIDKKEKKGLVKLMNADDDRYIIFSDQHKGTKNGADDFRMAEKNYINALDYYYREKYHFISLGDAEELWENSIWSVPGKNKENIEKEKNFLDAGRFYKVFGNHDLYWNNDPLASFQLKRMYGSPFWVYEGLVLRINFNGRAFDIFLTHGHQGDGQSDGNKLSAWLVSSIWAPLQSLLEINPNTPATNDEMKTLHNRFMYEWSAAQKDIMLITGHTHQPIFASLTHLESLYKQLVAAQLKGDNTKQRELENEIIMRKKEYHHVSDEFLTMKPSYFNSGCCCFNDGDITGIEIADGKICLIKWDYDQDGSSQRIVLEEAMLYDIITAIGS